MGVLLGLGMAPIERGLSFFGGDSRRQSQPALVYSLANCHVFSPSESLPVSRRTGAVTTHPLQTASNVCGVASNQHYVNFEHQ